MIYRSRKARRRAMARMHPTIQGLTPRQREIIGLLNRGERLVWKWGHGFPHFESLPPDDKRRTCSSAVAKALKAKRLIEFYYQGDGWYTAYLTKLATTIINYREKIT